MKIQIINNTSIEFEIVEEEDIYTCTIDSRQLRGGLFDNKKTHQRFVNHAINELLIPYPEIQELTIRTGEIDNLPASIGQLKNLRNLDITNCGLKILPQELQQLRELKSIIVKYNNLKEIPDFFDQDMKISHLDLRFNPLTSLPDSLSTLTSLTILKLSNTDFTEFPLIITKLVNLVLLSISIDNDNVIIPDELKNLTALQNLTISNSKLEMIPAVIFNLTQLTSLSFKCNELTFLPEEIGKLIHLKKLCLSSNNEITFPNSLLLLTSLIKLDLSDIIYTEYPDILFKLEKQQAISIKYDGPSFETLKLMANYFKKIQCKLYRIDNLSETEQLNYLQNIFSCHTQMYPFHNFELRESSQSHPSQRKSLTLLNIDQFVNGYHGGFCFQNTRVLYKALKYVGFSVHCSIAKVLNGLEPESEEAKDLPFTHLIMIVTIGEMQYLVDPSLAMNGVSSPMLISDSDDQNFYLQNDHQFKIEHLDDYYLLSRKNNAEWTTVSRFSSLPAENKSIETQLMKLECFPKKLNIRDKITLVGIGTPNGGKSLLWNQKSATFTFKEICAGNPDKIATTNDINIAYDLLCQHFKIEHVSKMQFKKLCEKVKRVPAKKSIEINFPIDDGEIASIRKSF